MDEQRITTERVTTGEESFEDQIDAYFAPIYSKLESLGVPDDRMPTILQVLSHVMECVDQDVLDTWVAAYARVEGRHKP